MSLNTLNETPDPIEKDRAALSEVHHLIDRMDSHLYPFERDIPDDQNDLGMPAAEVWDLERVPEQYLLFTKLYDMMLDPGSLEISRVGEDISIKGAGTNMLLKVQTHVGSPDFETGVIDDVQQVFTLAEMDADGKVIKESTITPDEEDF